MGLNFPFTPSILTPSIPTILVYYRCCYSVWVNGNIHRSIEYKRVWGRKWSFLAFVIVFLTFVIWMKKTEQCLNSQKNIKPQIQQSALEIITRIFNANYAESDNEKCVTETTWGWYTVLHTETVYDIHGERTFHHIFYPQHFFSSFRLPFSLQLEWQF